VAIHVEEHVNNDEYGQHDGNQGEMEIIARMSFVEINEINQKTIFDILPQRRTFT